MLQGTQGAGPQGYPRGPAGPHGMARYQATMGLPPGQGQPGPNVAQRWVETGAAVEAMYHDMRADASDHARLRNTYFQQVRLQLSCTPAIHMTQHNRALGRL